MIENEVYLFCIEPMYFGCRSRGDVAAGELASRQSDDRCERIRNPYRAAIGRRQGQYRQRVQLDDQG